MFILSPAEAQQFPEARFIDARIGADARERYLQEHIKGAIHVDLDRDLASVKQNAADGGRHPLPTAGDFSALLGKCGISPDTTVLVYDDKAGANAASRFWWMLRALGHKKVYVISGGYQALKDSEFPLSSGIENITESGPYPADNWISPMADISEVEKAAADSNRIVIDVREGFRYRGEKEPIDLVAGHIPGAINIPFLENLKENGSFLSAEELAKKYNSLLGDVAPSQVIVHCGSGVTACHTLLALEHAGLSGAKLYVGSWSEWSRNNKPIATGNES